MNRVQTVFTIVLSINGYRNACHITLLFTVNSGQRQYKEFKFLDAHIRYKQQRLEVIVIRTKKHKIVTILRTKRRSVVKRLL